MKRRRGCTSAVMAVAGAWPVWPAPTGSSVSLYRATPGFAGTIGFDAIALALLGRSHPGGVVARRPALRRHCGPAARRCRCAPTCSIDLILVIQALVVVFIAAPALIRAIYRVRTGEEAERLTTDGGRHDHGRRHRPHPGRDRGRARDARHHLPGARPVRAVGVRHRVARATPPSGWPAPPIASRTCSAAI